ncbi:MvdC/MvdD family ATP grasp protein [Anabaena catenula]
MIVIFSNSLDVTADYVCSRLEQVQLNYIRLDTDNLIGRIELLYKLNNFSLIVDHQTLEPQSISSVWYRRPQRLSFPEKKPFEKGEQAHTTSEWRGAIEGFLAHIPTKLWINHPKNNSSASSKLEQLTGGRNQLQDRLYKPHSS